MRTYNYRSESHSALTKGFVRVVVKPLSNFIPQAMPAHFISIITHLVVYLAFYLSYQHDLNGPPNYFLIAFLLLMHLVGDKLDGMHARKHGSASALGEFIDHYLEVFSQVVMLYTIFNLYHISHAWIIIAVVGLVVLLLATKYYEQFKTGNLVIGKIGAFELKLLFIIVICSSQFEPILELLNQPDLYGYSAIEAMLVLLTLGALVNLIYAVVRIPQITYGFWLFAGLMLVITGLGVMVFDPEKAGLLLLLYGGIYLGKLLTAQLVDGIERSPGFFTPIFLSIQYLTGYFNVRHVFFIISLYLAVNILLLIIRVFKALKDDWHWNNPATDSAA